MKTLPIMKLYRLDGHEPKLCETWEEWGEHYLRDDHAVARSPIGRCEVSTIFLGLDHIYRQDRPPLLFETMVFGGAHDRMTRRCSTWDEALKMHEEVCAMVQRANGGGQ